MLDKKVFSEYVKIYTKELSDDRESNFTRGDVAIEIYNAYQEDKKANGSSKVIDEFLFATKESRSAFMQRKWVSEKFTLESDRKLPGLNWTAYRICANTNDPLSWLKKCYDDEMSCAKLITEIKEASAEVQIDSGLLCPQCNSKIGKDEVVSVSYKKKRTLLCSPKCAISYLKAEEPIKVHPISLEKKSVFDEDPDSESQSYSVLSTQFENVISILS
jgi:hypothetical protein